MVSSAASQPRVTVKSRGSKWRIAEAESMSDRDASRRDIGTQDNNRSLDPARDRQARVLTQ